MKLLTPNGGTVYATGEEAKRLLAYGFTRAETEPPKPKATTRKRKTASK